MSYVSPKLYILFKMTNYENTIKSVEIGTAICDKILVQGQLETREYKFYKNKIIKKKFQITSH